MSRFAILVFVVAAPCYGDIIVGKPTSTNIGKGGTFFGQPFAESFTATESEASVGTVSFLWGGGHVDPNFPISSAPTYNVELRSGVGFLGTILASQSSGPVPVDTPEFTWIDFKFSNPVTLIPGNQYTLKFVSTATSAGTYVGTSDVYPGGTELQITSGQILQNDPGHAIPAQDMSFRVLAVPEPTTATLLLLGMLGCGWRRCR